MSQESVLSQLIVAAFEGWAKADVPFVVLRNYENLPNATTNDIDVLVPALDRDRAVEVLVDAAYQHGFVLNLRTEYATLALYFSSKTDNTQVHFDLFDAFTWRGLPYLEAEPFFEQRRSRAPFAVPAPLHEAGCN